MITSHACAIHRRTCPTIAAPLGRDSINTMISETFCIPPSLTAELSSIVFHKTAGAPIYVLNFLQSLCEEGLIRFSLTARRWEYHIKGIRMKELPNGVVQYMRSQMLQLPESDRLVLKVAACLGHRFDYNTFQVRTSSAWRVHAIEGSACAICLAFSFGCCSLKRGSAETCCLYSHTGF